MTDHYIAGLEKANRQLRAQVDAQRADIKRQQTQVEAALAGTHQPEHGWQCPCCTHVRRALGAET